MGERKTSGAARCRGAFNYASAGALELTEKWKKWYFNEAYPRETVCVCIVGSTDETYSFQTRCVVLCNFDEKLLIRARSPVKIVLVK